MSRLFLSRNIEHGNGRAGLLGPWGVVLLKVGGWMCTRYAGLCTVDGIMFVFLVGGGRD
jgi:hypothetical protein